VSVCEGGPGSVDVRPGIVVEPSDTVAVHGVDEAVEFECVVNARSAELSIDYFHCTHNAVCLR